MTRYSSQCHTTLCCVAGTSETSCAQAGSQEAGGGGDQRQVKGGRGGGWGRAYLGPARAGRVLRELLNDGVPEEVEAIDDGGGEAQYLHTQQVDAIPDVARAQVQGVGDTHIHVEDEGTDVEGHGKPAIPVDLSLQHSIM